MEQRFNIGEEALMTHNGENCVVTKYNAITGRYDVIDMHNTIMPDLFSEDLIKLHEGGYSKCKDSTYDMSLTINTNLDEVEEQLARIEASLGRINGYINDVQAVFSGNETPLAFTKIVRD